MKALLQAVYGKWDLATPLFLHAAPQGQSKPYAVYLLVSDVPDYTFDSQSDVYRIQFSVFSESGSATEALDILTDIEELYNDCSMTITGRQFVKMERVSSQLLKDFEDARTYWHVIVEYQVWMHKQL